MGHYTQEEVPPGWEEFAAENALVLIRERDKKIHNLRRAVKQLLKGKASLRKEVARLRAELAEREKRTDL